MISKGIVAPLRGCVQFPIVYVEHCRVKKDRSCDTVGYECSELVYLWYLVFSLLLYVLFHRIYIVVFLYYNIVWVL